MQNAVRENVTVYILADREFKILPVFSKEKFQHELRKNTLSNDKKVKIR